MPKPPALRRSCPCPTRRPQAQCAGAVALEFVLLLPLFALLLAGLLGIAAMLNLKQQSMHMARYAALSHAATGQAVSTTAAQKALAGTRDRWQLALERRNTARDPFAGGSSDIASLLAGAIGGATAEEARYRMSGRTGTINLLQLNTLAAEGYFALPAGYWDSNQCGLLFGDRLKFELL